MEEEGKGGDSHQFPHGQERACLRGGTADVSFLREAIKRQLVSLMQAGAEPCFCVPTLRRGQPMGQRGDPGPAWEQPPGRARRSRTPHPRTLRGLPPRPGRWVRGIQVKEEVAPEPLPGPAASPRRAPRSRTGPGALGAAGDRTSPVAPVCILILKSGNGNCLMYEETLSN